MATARAASCATHSASACVDARAKTPMAGRHGKTPRWPTTSARKALGPAELYERLDASLQLLVAGHRTAPDRHQTLRATLDWSYALLALPEQVIFRRLSVFAGGWNLAAAEAVCAASTGETSEFLRLHSRLVDKSLVDPQRF